MLNFAGFQDLKKVAESQDRLIYSALRISDQKPVILKTLRSEHPSLDNIALMYHEYQIAKDLNFPGIIQIYDLIDQKNQYALVQEDMEGAPLPIFLEKQAVKNLSLFFKLAISMAHILNELHKNHIIHKDIKPNNFIIHSDPFMAKITGFDFSSKLLHEEQDIVSPNKLEGTLAYMAPEQTGRMNMKIDYRSDFYALGVVFYEILSGHLPFSYEDPLELLHAHLANPMPDINNPYFEIPATLKKIIQKLMSKNPSDRYQSASGLAMDLERCQKELGTTGKISDFALGENDIFDRLNLSQKMYGREQEVKTLLAAYDRVSQGSVEALMVCGYSGIGKTTLINEVHRPMVKHKGYFISGKFDQLQKNTPYTAITQALNKLARLILAEPELRFEAMKKNILNALGDVAQVIIDLAPDLELIIGKQKALEILPPRETQNRMMIFFKRFLRSIASSQHPLVIFIDDLQWIDSSSLKLLEYILTDEELTHVLLIGAYRDNEVDSEHPLRHFFKEINQEKNIQFLSLEHLQPIHYQALFEDSFHSNADAIKPLADLIYKRTEGNPFFCKQLIFSIYREKLLYFKGRQWSWNLDSIKDLKMSDNVVDLMLKKLSDLPAETQELLKYASCVGNRFTIEMLMLITGQSADTLEKTLWAALQEELIVSLQSRYHSLLSKNISFQFAHDRIQQVVYQHIPLNEKQQTHLLIARSMMKKDPEACKKELLFEVTDHFNQSLPLLNPDEKVAVTELNYKAGLQAKNANAYQPMFNYLTSGLQIIPENSWEENYELTFRLNKEYALSLFLLTQIEKANHLIDTLLNKAKTVFDKVSLYRIQIMNDTVQGKLEHAFLSSKIALNLLGVKINLFPKKINLFLKLFQVRFQLRKFHMESLDRDLPLLSDSHIILAFEILNELVLPASWRSIQFFIYLRLLAMHLLLKYGKPKGAGMWVNLYGEIELNLFNHIDFAFQTWKVSEKLIEEIPDKYSSGIAYFGHALLLNNLYFPPKIGEVARRRSLQDCVESGNAMGAQLATNLKRAIDFSIGKSLKDLIESCKKSLYEAKKFKGEGVEIGQLCLHLYEAWAIGAHNCENEIKIVEEKLKQSENAWWKAEIFSILSSYFYFMENYERCVEFHDLWYKHESLLRYEAGIFEIKTLNALAIAKCIPEASGIKKWKYQHNFTSLLKNLKKISSICPGNFLHHYLFLEGTQAKMQGQTKKALALFNQAIENAKMGDFYLWVALGNELAAEMLTEEKESRCAYDYIREAHYYYLRFGILAKVKALEIRYPECFIEKTEASTLPSTKTTTSANLDFMSVIKASQTISGEMVLDKLFEKMLHIAVENAGARKAIFLENRKNTWVVAASLEVGPESEEFTMPNINLNQFEALPQTVVQYVLRSKDSLVLNHAIEDNQYRQDPYFVRTQSKSVLCLPILHHDALIGAIYLENNLTIGAFTQERVTVLTTLASQIAISLENSHYLDQMRRLYQSTERFVPKEFLNLLKKETIEDIKVGDSVEVNLAPMFADIRNYTTIAEALGTEKSAFLLNSYMQKMSPIIRRHHGFVSQFFGDGIMALFPNQYVDAVDAAIKMRAALPEFNSMIQEHGYDPIEIGIGLNAGPAMLITLGEEERIDASVISDVVNSAARIEGLNKLYGTGMLMSDSVYNSIKNPQDYLIRLIDKVKVKGRKQAMRIYEVMTAQKNESPSSVRHYIERFQTAFAYYEAGDFKSAKEEFKNCLQIRPNDTVASLFEKRSDTFLNSGAPSDWDGTYTALEK